ncbi:hypothetical protein [uncultured Caballeronia sp.]|uniref:hypothetical protein n=1 Tax=uncultured Caballeronia sp. TaxID=1827198 RepID=UPI0015773C6A
MLSRRSFLSRVCAFGGSYALAGCGGGGGSSDSSAASKGVSVAAAPTGSSAVTVTQPPAAAAAPVAASGAASEVAVPDAAASEPVEVPDDSAVKAASGMFYGMNGHYDYLYTPSQTVAILQALGCTSYRLTCFDAKSLNALVNMAKAFVGTGISLFVCIDESLTDASGVVWTSEAAAYNQGFQSGSTIAAALMPYGVTMYECGNELTRRSQTVIDSSSAGNRVTDFNNTNWPAMRGVMRGMMDGVRSVQPGAKCGINFCVADIGASDALWDGTQPDGTTGHPQLRWDITTWHNYEVYGDIFNIGVNGGGPNFDLPAYCKKRYGVPFMITEWNANPEDSQAFRASYITERLTRFYAARKTDNIESVMYYVLDSGNTSWGILIDGKIVDPEYSAMRNFILANPDT